jgi:hypothetical protein
MDSHCGELASVYVSCEDGEKVEGEKTNEKGWPTLATGGTWEFIGKVIAGMAVASPTRRVIAHGRIEGVMMLSWRETARRSLHNEPSEQKRKEERECIREP